MNPSLCTTIGLAAVATLMIAADAMNVGKGDAFYTGQR